MGLRVNILWLNGTPSIGSFWLHCQEVKTIQQPEVYGLKCLRRLVKASKLRWKFPKLFGAQVTGVVLYRHAASGAKCLDEDVNAVGVGCQRRSAGDDNLVSFGVCPEVGILRTR